MGTFRAEHISYEICSMQYSVAIVHLLGCTDLRMHSKWIDISIVSTVDNRRSAAIRKKEHTFASQLQGAMPYVTFARAFAIGFNGLKFKQWYRSTEMAAAAAAEPITNQTSNNKKTHNSNAISHKRWVFRYSLRVFFLLGVSSFLFCLNELTSGDCRL